MPDTYLIVHKSVLPDYFEKVLQARRLLESGKVREVSEAVRRVRCNQPMADEWKADIEEDFNSRGW